MLPGPIDELFNERILSDPRACPMVGDRPFVDVVVVTMTPNRPLVRSRNWESVLISSQSGSSAMSRGGVCEVYVVTDTACYVALVFGTTGWRSLSSWAGSTRTTVPSPAERHRRQLRRSCFARPAVISLAPPGSLELRGYEGAGE